MNTKNYDSLIGKNIVADGWYYDNGGTMAGVISEIVFNYYSSGKLNEHRVEVYVREKMYSWHMESFTFTIKQLDILLECCELPIANQFLSQGTNAKIF
jgi:hypothetical protein